MISVGERIVYDHRGGNSMDDRLTDNRDTTQALRELDGIGWLLGIPLAIGLVVFIWGCSIQVSDIEWERRFELEPTYDTGPIVKVAREQCADQPEPVAGSIDYFCGDAPAEWYVPVYDPEGCGSETNQCYVPATFKLTYDYLEESSDTLIPIGGIGLIPLALVFIAIRKVSKARKCLKSSSD